MLKKIILSFVLFYSVAHSAHEYDLTHITDIIAPSLYELNEKKIELDTNNFLKKNTNIKYMIIHDSLVNQSLISYYRDKENNLIKANFDQKDFAKTCNRISKKINFQNEHIGELIVCLSEKKSLVNLSPEEKAWIRKNHIIKVHNEYNWPPFNFNKEGMPLGYSIDYIKLLAQSVGLHIEFVTGTWDDLLADAFNKKIDVMMNIVKTKERAKKLSYVGIYARNVTSILTKNERNDISDIESLYGKKVSVVKGFFYEKFLKENYPKIKIKTYDNTLETIKAVMYDDVDATLAKTSIVNYLLTENMIKGLKYTSDVKTGNSEIENLYIATRNDAPILTSILKKALYAFPLEEVDKLKLKWFKEKRKIKFTKKEYHWLDKKKIITYSEVNWKPLSIIENDSMTGIMGDYLNLVSEMTGIEFKFVPSKSWPEVLEKFKKGEIDLVPGIGDSEEETSLGSVSSKYATYPMVIVTNDNIEGTVTLKDLRNKVFSIPKYYTSYNYIKSRYPSAKIIETNNIFEALLNVSNGNADVFVGHIAPALYNMGKIGKNNLKISGNTGKNFNHHYLINSNMPELLSIVNKVFRVISEKDREKIYNGWVKVKVEQKTAFSLKKALYYILPPILIILIIISIIVYWNRKLQSLVAKKTRDINNQKLELEKLLASFDKNVIASKTDKNGKITYVSDAFRKMSEYESAELIGKTHSILRHPDMKDSVYKELWETILAGNVWKGELKNLKKGGDFYWVEAVISPEFDSEGTLLGYNAIRQDITDRKEVEELTKNLELKVKERTKELSEQKKFIQTLVDSQEQIVITTDGKELKSGNRKFLEFFDVSSIEEFKKGHDCICDTFAEDKTNLYIQKRMDTKTWIEYILDNKDMIHKVIINKDGEDKIFRVSAALMPLEKENLKSAVFTDITELENVRKNIEVILSNIMLPVLITSTKERTILYANEYASIQYETPVEELIGKPIDSVYTSLSQKDEILDEMKKYGYVENLEQKYQTRTGKEFIALLSVKPIKYCEEDAFIGMVVDITKQKDIEEQLRLIHKQTQDSIEYASLIQHALIPSNDLFRKYFSDYLTIWHPKDIVGGDIYLFEELRDDNECLLMVIDCTGHGVPGAFVTMLVKAIERQVISDIINSKDEVSPAKILAFFNKNMKYLLKQEDENSISNAGFDGGILYYNKKESIVKFAGAETPLFYEYEGEVKTIKGNRHSIGYKKSDFNYEFKEHTIKAKKEMQFYLTTDGYLDQNGGGKGFPFGKRRFVKIIEENYEIPFADQQEVLLYEMMAYQKENERNDDMTIVGVKI